MVRTLLDELPGPQRLALSYAPAASRSATLAVLALDARLGAIIRRRGEPAMAQLRLAWWRDILAAAPAAWPPGDPVLSLLRDWRRPAALGSLVDGWEGLLAERLHALAIGEFARGRCDACAELARELSADTSSGVAGARLWALGDLAANLSDPGERAAVIEAAAPLAPGPPLPRSLRPLAVLAGLGRRSLRRGGAPLLDGPGAALTAIRLGITGR